MIRILPFVLIIVVILGGLGYWRYVSSKQSLSSPQSGTTQDQTPIEVPKTLPEATLDDRVKALEDLTSKIVTSVNSLKSSINPGSSSNVDTRLSAIEAAVTELKVRVSALEKPSSSTTITATTGSSGKSTIYIPLGSGGQESDTNWVTISTFQISLNPAQYPGYTSMQLEVTMRLNQPGGTLSARLYNLTDGTVVSSSSASTTSTSEQLVNSSGFTLSSGTKTYVLQANTSDGSLGFLDYARIRVNF